MSVETNTAPLAIAAITALLRDVLANGIIRVGGAAPLGDVHVTVVPPDRITLGAEEPNQLNLFLYRVEPQVAMPATARRPDIRRRDVALKLHYLVTAYSAQDYHAELLLGCALSVFCALPLLTAQAARALLTSKPRGSGSGSPTRDALAGSDVLDAMDRITLTQQFLSLEDTSKLWSMMQSRYRPSIVYEVSAVRVAIDD